MHLFFIFVLLPEGARAGEWLPALVEEGLHTSISESPGDRATVVVSTSAFEDFEHFHDFGSKGSF